MNVLRISGISGYTYRECGMFRMIAEKDLTFRSTRAGRGWLFCRCDIKFEIWSVSAVNWRNGVFTILTQSTLRTLIWTKPLNGARHLLRSKAPLLF